MCFRSSSRSPLYAIASSVADHWCQSRLGPDAARYGRCVHNRILVQRARAFLNAAPDLHRFLECGTPPIYFGFGSMAGDDPTRTAREVIKALKAIGQRGVLARGWGGLQAGDAPEHVHLIDEAPHSWLFPRCAAVVHHGGAGTTREGLRWGKPTLIRPVFGDQPFWGRRVEATGPITDTNGSIAASKLPARWIYHGVRRTIQTLS